MTKAIKKARIITIRSFIAILGIFFGVLVTAQWRSIPTRVVNPIAPYVSLKDTKEELYKEQEQLKNEIKDLQRQITTTQKNFEDVALTKSEIKALNEKKALAGLTELNGRGVIITLDDSKNSITNEDSIIHAADLRDLVNLLWGSGAEGISVNNQRVVLNTSIDCIVNTILINNVRISSPFVIEAVGNQEVMYDKINNPQILTNLYKRKNEQGLIFNIIKNNDITVPLFDGSFDIDSES